MHGNVIHVLDITGTTEYFGKIQNNRYSENWKHFENLFQNAKFTSKFILKHFENLFSEYLLFCTWYVARLLLSAKRVVSSRAHDDIGLHRKPFGIL
jgi:hypothetical protein